jgi:hypothetical protein
MNLDDTTDSSLERRLAALDPEIAPGRDLWPGIHAAIGTAPARRWPLALAAGLATVALAGALLGWQIARLRTPSAVVTSRAPAPSVGAPAEGSGDSFTVPETQSFVATRAMLEQTYQQRLALLAPATRRRVEQDLATIRAANADIRKALAADPRSAVLSHLLASTLQQEFDLYSTVIRNTAPAADRSPS